MKQRSWLTAILGLLFLWDAQLFSGEVVTKVEDKATTEILTPSLASRKVGKIRLANGLEAYLVSDPEATQSAAALAVEVGAWDDPEAHPGMAHFLEHMLFLGTTKYPKESEYSDYITQHAGRRNAYTTSDHTNYAFSVNHEAFPEALDRFSWFFKEPLFNPSGVEREMRAVHSEHAKNIEQDERRIYAVFREQANPYHPISRFQTGNLDTLSAISQDSLKEFYYNHYSANLMHLVVISSLGLEELETLVIESFKEVPTSNRQALVVDKPILSNQQIGKVTAIQPLKDMRSVSMVWELPSQFAHMLEARPDDLVSFVLGHEGEESLLAQLKREKLAEGLSSGGYPYGNNNFLFEIEVSLTRKGVKEVNQVIERTFQGIKRLQQGGIPDYLFKEMQAKAKVDYQYQSRSEPYYLAMSQARQLIREPLETFPEVTQIPQWHDPSGVNEVLGFLTPENCFVTTVAKEEFSEVSPDRKEKWMGVEYSTQQIPNMVIEKWAAADEHESIDIPAPNILMPENLPLLHTGETDESYPPKPTLISQTNKSLIYYKQDNRYLVPEVFWTFKIMTPEVDPFSAESLILTDLYVKAITEALNPFSYNAALAGIDYSISGAKDGITLTINGYSEKAHLLFQEILKTLKTVTPTQEQFNIYKDSIRRGYENFAKESPLTQGFETMRTILYREYITNAQKAKTIAKVSYRRFLNYRDKLYDKTFVEGMLYGNLNVKQASAVWRELDETLDSRPYPMKDHIQPEVVYLPESEGPYFLCRKVKQQGNALLLMLQSGGYSFKQRAAHQILSQAINEPFYTELRTKQQTGYIVFNSDDVIERQLYSFFGIQSHTHDVRDLLARFELMIESFLNDMGRKTLPEERFETIRQSLITKLEKPEENLASLGTVLNALAFEQDADFELINRRIAGLKALSYEEFFHFARAVHGRENRQRVAVMVQGKIESPDYLRYQQVRSTEKIKKSSSYVTRKEASAVLQDEASKKTGS